LFFYRDICGVIAAQLLIAVSFFYIQKHNLAGKVDIDKA